MAKNTHPADIFQASCLRTSRPPEVLCPEAGQRKALGAVLREIGRCSEEADILKKHLFYGREADLSAYANALEDGLPHTRKTIKILHALLGIQSELREIIDGLCRGDDVTVLEDLGDILWYVSEGLDGIDQTMSEAMARNTAKLQVRFPEEFRKDLAIHKNSALERIVLEGAVDQEPDVS